MSTEKVRSYFRGKLINRSVIKSLLDLRSFDFFLWSFLKSRICNKSPKQKTSLKELKSISPALCWHHLNLVIFKMCDFNIPHCQQSDFSKRNFLFKFSTKMRVVNTANTKFYGPGGKSLVIGRHSACTVMPVCYLTMRATPKQCSIAV